MKTPGAADEAINDLVDQELGEAKPDDEDFEYEREAMAGDIKEKLKKWLQYGENLRVEIDLDAGTAVVIPYE
jgi:hypothetical protein